MSSYYRGIQAPLSSARRAQRQDVRELRRVRRIRVPDKWPLVMWILVAALIVLAFMMPSLWNAHEAFHNRSAEQRP